MELTITRITFLCLIGLLMLSSCHTTVGKEHSDTSLTVLTIGTADNGGTMYPVGSAIAEIITESNSRVKINVSASNGSMMNVQMLSSGEIDLGLVSGDVAYAAVNGLDEFDNQPVEGLRAVAAVYSSSSNWIVPDSSDAIYVHDLVGKRIGVGPRDSTTELSARIAIEALGLEQAVLDNCSLSSGGQKVMSGQLDALHAFTGIPVIALTELSEIIPCRILQFTDDELRIILSQNEFYYRTVIPANTYKGQTDSVETFGVKCLLCVDASMDDELVYALIESLWQINSPEDYHASMRIMQQDGFMYQDIPIPLHDGATQFYKDVGLLE